MQLDNVSEEEEAGKYKGESEGSLVAKADKLRSRMDRGEEGGDTSSDSLSKVMIWRQRSWSGWKSRTKRMIPEEGLLDRVSFTCSLWPLHLTTAEDGQSYYYG